MKAARKQISTYLGLVFFIILATFTIVPEQSMAEKVFASYDSQIVHEKECRELDLSKELVEFSSVQEAVASGGLPCAFCMSQYAGQTGNQQDLAGNTISHQQTMNTEDTQTKTDNKVFSSDDRIDLLLKIKDKWVGPWFVNTDRELSYDEFRLPLKGRDKWGPFSVQVRGKVFDTGKIMIGLWDTDHGAYGNYKGTFYGIRLDSDKAASASITDQGLYQTMVNFESLQ